MLRLKVMDMLKERYLTVYWLHRQLGMDWYNCKRMLLGQTKSIKYEYLEAMCILFDCTPGDLFEYDPEK